MSLHMIAIHSFFLFCKLPIQILPLLIRNISLCILNIIFFPVLDSTNVFSPSYVFSLTLQRTF